MDALCFVLFLDKPFHDDAIKGKHFPRYWPFVWGIHRSPVNSPHKGQWRGALIFSLIRALNRRLSKQSWGWWFKTPPRSLRRLCNNDWFCVVHLLTIKELPTSSLKTRRTWVNESQESSKNCIMMTSSNGNIFRVTGPLYGEFTGHQWIPLTKASDVELWCLFDRRLNNRLSKQSWGCWFETSSRPLWRHCKVNPTQNKQNKIVPIFHEIYSVWTSGI